MSWSIYLQIDGLVSHLPLWEIVQGSVHTVVQIDPNQGTCATVLRGTILNRTYGTYKILCISLFLLTMFGPIYYGPPYYCSRSYRLYGYGSSHPATWDAVDHTSSGTDGLSAFGRSRSWKWELMVICPRWQTVAAEEELTAASAVCTRKIYTWYSRSTPCSFSDFVSSSCTGCISCMRPREAHKKPLYICTRDRSMSRRQLSQRWKFRRNPRCHS